MASLKQSRIFLENLQESDSYVRVHVDEHGIVSLKLADCDRRIWWTFGKPGEKRALAKIRKVKAVIDSIHDHLVGVVKP